MHETGHRQNGPLFLTELEMETVLYFAKYAPVNECGFVSNLACMLMNIVRYGYKKFRLAKWNLSGRNDILNFSTGADMKEFLLSWMF